MNPTDVERVYEALAETLDTVGTESSQLFLAKLVLLLSSELSDADLVLNLISMASSNLDVATNTSGTL